MPRAGVQITHRQTQSNKKKVRKEKGQTPAGSNKGSHNKHLRPF